MNIPRDRDAEAAPGSALCLPERSNWGVVAMLLLLGAAWFCLLLIPPGPGFAPLSPQARLVLLGVLCALAAPFVGGAIWMARRIQRGFIIADGEKITWRHAGRVRQARWGEVHDYYYWGASGSLTYTIETSAGRLRLGGDWSSSREMALFIHEHALDARATEWQLRVPFEKHEWPRRFHYQTFQNRWLLPLLLSTLALSFCGLYFGGASRQQAGAGAKGAVSLSQISEVYGWPMTILMVVPLALAVLTALAFAYLLAVSWLNPRRRWHQSIQATPEGLRWTDGARSVASTWDEVRAFSFRRGKGLSFPCYQVETVHGDFDFTSDLSGCVYLLRLIEERATNARASSWRVRDAASERPVQHRSGRVYHYRTTEIRALLCGVTFLGLALLVVVPLVRRCYEVDGNLDSKPVPWLLLPLALAALSWAWWRYRAAGVRTDEHGIAQLCFNGERFLAWDSVGKYLQTSADSITVEGHAADGQAVRLRFSTMISGVDELREEIKLRAVHASNRDWADKAPGASTKRR